MTRHDLHALRAGDVIQSRLTQRLYLVTSNHGDHVTAIQPVDVTHPEDWALVAKACYAHLRGCTCDETTEKQEGHRA